MRKVYLTDRTCTVCGSKFNRKKYPSGVLEAPTEFRKRKYCSRECYHTTINGSGNPSYKDGFKRGHDGGYLRFSNDRYVHRATVEEHIGRGLTGDEHVHHIDGDVENNAIENLEIVTNSNHRRLHCATQYRNSSGQFAVREH